MFHASLFALLGAMFVLFAFAAGGAGLLVVAVPSGLLALWMGDASFRAARAAVRRRQAGTTTDGRQ